MLPTWNPDRLAKKIPFVLGLTGGRRQGKSTAVADLLSRMSGRFDLVICMVGSAACNPVLEALLTQHWDPRFFFSEWDSEMIEKLLEQQETLQKKREVLIILDDVILGSQAEDQLAHMCMRGRHFRISICMCAVSYTTLPKRARRSLDTLLVFSCPMKGDMQVLTWEFCQNQAMARLALTSLRDYECLVLETLEKKQTLFVWRADLISLDTGSETLSQKNPDESQTQAADETPAERPHNVHQNDIVSPPDRMISQEPQPADVAV